MKKTIFILYLLLATQPLFAKLQNPKEVISAQSWGCSSDGWSLTVTNFKDGTATVSFHGYGEVYFRDVSLASYEPFLAPPLESYETHYASAQPHQICMKHRGFFVNPGEKYYSITKKSHKPWKNTVIDAQMSSNDLPIDFNSAAEAMAHYHGILGQHANGQAVPTSCGEQECQVNATGSGTNNEDNDPMNRVSITDIMINNPEISTVDAINLWKGTGSNWGNSEEDIKGLSINWVKVLGNLGIINTQQIKKQILDRWHQVDDQGRHFVFKKLEHKKMEFLPLVDDDEDITFLILPKKKLPSNALTWPTGLFIKNQKEKPFYRQGQPNPAYCPENDPLNDRYIPQYVSDSNVLMELVNDIDFLTEDQLNKLKDEKGIDSFAYLEDLPEQQQQNSMLYRPNKSRIKYDCHIAENQSKTENLQAVEVCKTKDVAYYDQLINKLIVLNPELHGNINNHPCKQARIAKPVKAIKQIQSPKKPRILKVPVKKIKKAQFKKFPG